MILPRAAGGLVLLGLPAVPVLATEGGDPGGALITPHYGTLIWTGITFLLLLFILRRYAWGPLLGALDAREASIRDSIDQAQKDRAEAEKTLEEHRELVAEAHRQRAAALAEGQREAEKVKAEILEEARKQRETLLAQTETQVQAGLRQARSELRGVAADLAIRAAGKLLSRNLDDAAQRRLVEEYLADLESSAESGPPPS